MPTPAENLYSQRCPICKAPIPDQRPAGSKRIRIECRNCGTHDFASECLGDRSGTIRREELRPWIAYRLRRVSASTLITSELIAGLAKDPKLPGAMERVDNLILHLAVAAPPGQACDADPMYLRAAIGAATSDEVRWVIVQADHLGYLSKAPGPFLQSDQPPMMALSIEGWNHHAKLLKDGAGSRHAFMAMDFNDPQLDEFFRLHLCRAVREADFELRTTNHGAKTAGLIDNRMRVDIRTSRFVVCDLTHGNRGAYWEAGFAEGIGRHVFYICRHDVRGSADPATRPHFDTAHQTIIAWDPDNPTVAAEELKAMIRATLPAEARMQDA